MGRLNHEDGDGTRWKKEANSLSTSVTQIFDHDFGCINCPMSSIYEHFIFLVLRKTRKECPTGALAKSK